MKPIKFHELRDGSLFRIYSERRVVYDKCERVEKYVKSKDFTVYKKHGPGHSSSKPKDKQQPARTIILAPHDLVVEYVPVDKRG